MKQKKQSVYRGAMAVFYSICLVAWNLYLKYWQLFKLINNKYTEEYGQSMLAAIEAAKELPNIDQRRANTEDNGNKLHEAAMEALLFWKKLKSNIMKSFDAATQEVALRKAGSALFSKAAKGNYNELSLLMIAGADFMTCNEAALLQGGMPATFAAAYTAATTAYQQEYAQYSKAKGQATNDTSEKTKANNALYAALKELLSDALIALEKEEAIRRQFTYKAIRNLVTKDVVCGFHFTVKDETTGRPLPTAAVTVSTKAESYTVNKRGALKLRLQKGTYTVVVSVPGYTPFMKEATVTAGVMHRISVKLKKADAVSSAA